MNLKQLVSEYEAVKTRAQGEVKKIISKALKNGIPVDLVISGVSKNHMRELIEATSFFGQHNAIDGIDGKLMHVITVRDVKKRKGNGHLKVGYADIALLVQ